MPSNSKNVPRPSSAPLCYWCWKKLRRINGLVIFDVLTDPAGNNLKGHKKCAKKEEPPCTAQPSDISKRPYYRERYEE